MLSKPRNGKRLFEVSVFNREVRALVRDNQHHDVFDDGWADNQRREVIAVNEEEARDVISQRYPKDEGFEIAAVYPGRPQFA